MNRRRFLTTSAGTAAAAGIVSGCRIEKIQKETPAKTASIDSGLAGKTLVELREQYRYDLYDDFLPFLDAHVIDHELGGFMCNTKPDGTNITTNKSAWYEGRGIWVYSFLHNKIEQNPAFLDVAKKSAEFILKNRPKDDSFWIGSYTKDGTPASKTPGDIYGNLFIAEGLAELSKAPGNEQYWDTAKELFLGAMRRYDAPDYRYSVTYGPKAEHAQPPRVLGHWMVIIRLATQMLEFREDAEIESLAARAVDAIMNYHFNPAYGLMNEVLNHDLSRAAAPFDQFSYTGHAIETLWMVMFEAARKKDSALYHDAADRFKRHVEVAWDDVYDGAFRCLVNVDNNEWLTDKVLWLQEEILIGTLFMIEHTGDQWAKDWFAKTFDYVQANFPQKPHGFPLWIVSSGRKIVFNPDSGRVENFHHPRHLMLNLHALDRMIDSNGAPSGMFG